MTTSHEPARPVVCITQARMGSSRLPGKVMLKVLGEPLLHWHIARLKLAKRIDKIVVATSNKPQDDPIAKFCRAEGIDMFRGSENDVLSRYAGAAEMANAATVVRVTSDCPLIDPGLIDEILAAYGALQPQVDYLSLDVAHYPRGLDTEVFSLAVLEEAHARATDLAEREHVTPYIYRRPERFRLAAYNRRAAGAGQRWCVDEPGDLELVTRVIETLAPRGVGFTWRDCLDLLRANPEWLQLNSHVAQNKI